MLIVLRALWLVSPNAPTVFNGTVVWHSTFIRALLWSAKTPSKTVLLLLLLLVVVVVAAHHRRKSISLILRY
jgi:hypothetical protein